MKIKKFLFPLLFLIIFGFTTSDDTINIQVDATKKIGKLEPF